MDESLLKVCFAAILSPQLFNLHINLISMNPNLLSNLSSPVS